MRARASPVSTSIRGGRSRTGASPRSTPRSRSAHWRTPGLDLSDVDAYLCDSTAGFGAVSMAEYLNLHPRYVDSTETGGSSYLVHVGHAAAAIAAGRCQVALVTMAGLARSRG